MDSQTFRDMCAVYAMQAMIAGNGGSPRNPAAIALQAFDVVAERLTRDRDAKRDQFGRVTGR